MATVDIGPPFAAATATAVKTLPTWVSICGALAPFTAIGVTMAPIPTIHKVSLDRSVGNLPLLPYSSMVSNAYVWVMYGLVKHEPKVWMTNLVGLALGFYYWNEYRKYCPKNATHLPGTLSLHYRVTFVIGLLISFSGLSLPVHMAARVVGLEGVVFCVLLFASPLSVLKHVVETKCAKSIPLPFTLACIINCVCWSVVGIFEMNDIMIYMPNILGLTCGLAQLLLKVMFGDGNHKDNGIQMTSSSASIPARVLPV